MITKFDLNNLSKIPNFLNSLKKVHNLIILNFLYNPVKSNDFNADYWFIVKIGKQNIIIICLMTVYLNISIYEFYIKHWR
jgi:hypothetical protein